jgi:predicted DsbA family dithiol-disulfide isomerase
LDKSEQLYEVLNRKHFIEGSLLNDLSMLKSALVEIGDVDVAKCESFLLSNDGVEAVLRTVDMVHAMGMRIFRQEFVSVCVSISLSLSLCSWCIHVIGVHSIPTLVIDGGRFVLDGATRAEEIMATLRQITRTSDSYSPRPRLFKDSMAF